MYIDNTHNICIKVKTVGSKPSKSLSNIINQKLLVREQYPSVSQPPFSPPRRERRLVLLSKVMHAAATGACTGNDETRLTPASAGTVRVCL